jgi:DNA-binding transcriptional LysR family regulator
MLVAGCATPPPAPAPPPPPQAAPAPVLAPPPPSQDWRETPVASGDWRWSRENGASVSRFGVAGQPPALEVRCDAARGEVVLVLAAATTASTSGPVSLTITTSTLARPLVADAQTAGDARLVARVPAHDPLLDAIAFSRGRWRIEAEGRAALSVPSWPEVARVIEDCR